MTLMEASTTPVAVRDAPVARRDVVSVFRRLAEDVVPHRLRAPDAVIALLLEESGVAPEALRATALLLRTRTVDELRRALRDCRDAPPRDPSLASLFSLGRTRFATASDARRLAWTVLATFRGSFTLGQAVAVLEACGIACAEDVLGDLVTAGIVVYRPSRAALFRLPAAHRVAARNALAADDALRARARRALLGWWSDTAAALRDDVGGDLLHEAIGWEECVDDLAALLHGGGPDSVDRVVGVVSGLLPLWVLTCRVDRAVELLEDALRTSSLSDRRRFDALFTLSYITTDVDRARRAVDEAGALATAEDARVALLRARALVALHRGDGAAAREHLTRALSRPPGDMPAAALIIDLPLMAAAHSLCGDQAEAQRQCERALRLCELQHDELQRNYVLWTFAMVAWRAGDHRRAYALAADGAESASQVGNPFTGAACLEVAAWHDASRGHAERAARLLGAAEGLRLRTGSPTLHWGAAEPNAVAVRAAVATLGETTFHSLFRDARATPLAEAVGWLREAPEDSSRLPAADHGLTARQIEIVDLIAAGRANKEIARELAISVNTVEKHVRHVFDRLEVASRAQVAAWRARTHPAPRGALGRDPGPSAGAG